MSTPSVSVIMNCYNSAAYLEDAINSVYGQDYKDWEIVFLDNASTDNSAKIAQAYDERLRYFRNNKTTPLGAARNKAIAHARGRYLAFLDCDDLWLSSKLSRQVKRLEQPAKGRPVALCYTDSMRMDADGNDILPFSYERRLVEGDVYLPLMRDCFFAMSSCLVDRAVCNELGGLDESLEYVEEWDLWLRIARLYDVAMVPDQLTRIRFHEANASRNFTAQEKECRRIIVRLPTSGADEERSRRRTLQRMDIRFGLVRLLHARRDGLMAFLREIGKLTLLCLRWPLAGISIARQYLNPKMVRFLLQKYAR